MRQYLRSRRQSRGAWRALETTRLTHRRHASRRFATSQLLGGFAGIREEKLRERANRTVLQCDDRGWIRKFRYVTRQQFERQMFSEPQHREREHGEEAA